MKFNRFIIIFILFMFLPVCIVTFLHSPYGKLVQDKDNIYTFTDKGKVISGNISKMPEEYKLLQKRILRNWNPPKLTSAKQLIFETHKNYDKKNKWSTFFATEKNDFNRKFNEKLEDKQFYKSAYRTLEVSSDSLMQEDLKYEVVFSYNPTFKDKKQLYINKIFIHKENFYELILYLFAFLAPAFPLLIAHLMYVFNVNTQIKELKEDLAISGDELILTAKKNWAWLHLIGLLWFLSLLFFTLGTSTDVIISTYNPKYAKLDRLIPAFTYFLILGTISCWFIVEYYNSFLVLTKRKVLKVKNGMIDKQINLENIYRVEDGVNSSDLGGNLSIIANKGADIRMNISSDPVKIKYKIEELVKQVKKIDNCQDESNENLQDDIEQEDDYTQDIEDETNIDIRYCQYCACEYPANQKRCPNCEKVNE